MTLGLIGVGVIAFCVFLLASGRRSEKARRERIRQIDPLLYERLYGDIDQ